MKKTAPSKARSIPATLVPGDGIGPEIVESAVGGGSRSVNVRLHEEGVRTRDLGGDAKTRDFTRALVRRVKAA